MNAWSWLWQRLATVTEPPRAPVDRKAITQRLPGELLRPRAPLLAPVFVVPRASRLGFKRERLRFRIQEALRSRRERGLG